MSTITWQAIPTRELVRIAETLEDLARETKPVLSTRLQLTIEGQARALRYHVEQAEGYGRAAAKQSESGS